jgi:hypothetical protein
MDVADGKGGRGTNICIVVLQRLQQGWYRHLRGEALIGAGGGKIAQQHCRVAAAGWIFSAEIPKVAGHDRVSFTLGLVASQCRGEHKKREHEREAADRWKKRGLP